MKITIKDIQKSPEKFHQMFVDAQAELASYKLKYKNLLEEIRLAKQHRFAPSSEKNILQPDLFDEAGVELPDEVKEQLDDEVEVKSYIRKKYPVRRKLPVYLPREVVLHDIPDGEKSRNARWLSRKGIFNWI